MAHGRGQGGPLPPVAAGGASGSGRRERSHRGRASDTPLVAAGHDPNPAFRANDEDAQCIADIRTESGQFHVIGVFDGHGGACTAKFVAKHLPTELAGRLDGGAAMDRALVDSFAHLDQQVGRGAVSDPTAGSTAAVLVLAAAPAASAAAAGSPGEKLAWVAHCGDSRIVLYDRGRTRRLTQDHTPAVAAEAERVRRAGGMIARNRVNGVLCVTRAFGDHEMKRLVPPTPDVARISLPPLPADGFKRFFINACDGLWDVMTDAQATEAVVRFVMLGRGEPKAKVARKAGEMLVRQALRLGSTDNVTALVIFC